MRSVLINIINGGHGLHRQLHTSSCAVHVGMGLVQCCRNNKVEATKVLSYNISLCRYILL